MIPQAPDCTVFVDAEISDGDLRGLVAVALAMAPAAVEIDILRNEDYDVKRRQHFPDGFIYFRCIMNLYLAGLTEAERIAVVGNLLERLWGAGFAAVAACPFEDALPERGGYRSQAIPWPD
ncbi:MAG: hypothetical protein SNJ59_03295 [Aggregatilineales bacterium]